MSCSEERIGKMRDIKSQINNLMSRIDSESNTIRCDEYSVRESDDEFLLPASSFKD